MRVEEAFVALYSGSQILVDQLNDGTVATVTLGAGNVPRTIQVTYLLERKGWYDLYREGVTVFSQWKFSTGFLVQEKVDNPSTELAASVVAAKCPAIRKVSAQDNKGLWTAWASLTWSTFLSISATKTSVTSGDFSAIRDCLKTLRFSDISNNYGKHVQADMQGMSSTLGPKTSLFKKN